MVSRISLAIGLLGLLAPALGAQSTTESGPALRSPRLVSESALLSLLPSARLAARPDMPAPVKLRFDPFTRESREAAPLVSPPSRDLRALPICSMPVQRADSSHDPMPTAAPDSTKKYFIRVAPPECVVEVSR